MSTIDSTARIGAGADIADDAVIGPWVIIEDGVTIGSGTRVDAHTIVRKGTSIGNHNIIHPYAMIGENPQDLAFKQGTASYVRIGDHNTIREFATIHRGTDPETVTVIGNHNLLMAVSHVAHNCHLADHVIVCNCALLSGHVEVEDYGFVSGGVVVQQFARIGRHAYVGGNTRVNTNIPPFIRAVGYNAEAYGLNTVGLRRRGFSRESISQLKRAYAILFRSTLRLEERLQQIEREADCEETRQLVAFIRKPSRYGFCRAARSGKGADAAEDSDA
jgi:UDP-N-acetylglucosamine acyltransferase